MCTWTAVAATPIQAMTDSEKSGDTPRVTFLTWELCGMFVHELKHYNRPQVSSRSKNTSLGMPNALEGVLYTLVTGHSRSQLVTPGNWCRHLSMHNLTSKWSLDLQLSRKHFSRGDTNGQRHCAKGPYLYDVRTEGGEGYPQKQT